MGKHTIMCECQPHRPSGRWVCFLVAPTQLSVFHDKAIEIMELVLKLAERCTGLTVGTGATDEAECLRASITPVMDANSRLEVGVWNAYIKDTLIDEQSGG